MRIFKWDKFNDIVEDRIVSIDVNEFNDLKENCISGNMLYKKIYQPEFEIGLFNKSHKTNHYIKENINVDYTYPKKDYSLVCTSLNESCDISTTFIVLPFKESLFTIKDNDTFLKGYWKDKIKWLEK